MIELEWVPEEIDSYYWPQNINTGSRVVHWDATQFFICGGFIKTHLKRSVSNAIIYDVADGEGLHLSSMCQARSYHGMCRIGSKIVCCGGSHHDSMPRIRTSEFFDNSTAQWKLLSALLPVGLSMQTCLAVNNFWVYSFGGVCDDQEQNMQLLRLDIRKCECDGAVWEQMPTKLPQGPMGAIKLLGPAKHPN